MCIFFWHPLYIFELTLQLFSLSDLSLIDKESDDVLERIMDEKTASESKILYGHSGPVYAVSFSPDRLEQQLKSC